MGDKIPACPNCGPSLTGSGRRCSRCGRELLYLGQEDLVGWPPGAAAAQARSENRAQPRGVWAGVTAAAVAVLALAGVIRPWDWLGRPVAGGQARMTASASERAARQAAAALPEASAPAAAADVGSAEAVRQDELEQTLERYLAALKERPSDAALLDRIGQTLVRLNRPAAAVPFLERAVESQPGSLVARFDLAGAYAQSGQPAKAADQYGVLVKAGSIDARVHHNHGLALRLLGRNAEALAAFHRATALAPDRAPAWLALALSLDAAGQKPEAVAALERYLSLQPAGQEAEDARAELIRLRAASPPAAPASETGSAEPIRQP
ncbi:MAG TPA: tetratricopeptide repeat protein [Vicinamibacterales bacterium]|nr:tetratricopeptide repeat protein [Vicinamibacterales bacterium]HPK70481.1 tetratricopeptide repeat protein [Vicinamibacterales bacterium]